MSWDSGGGAADMDVFGPQGARMYPYLPPAEVPEDRFPRRWLWINPSLGVGDSGELTQSVHAAADTEITARLSLPGSAQ
eukprot:6657605-Pyramimonas_sp.AAC.1